MKDSEVYLRAAELVFHGATFSCCAIDDVVGFVGSSQREAYSEVFKPDNLGTYAWAADWGEGKTPMNERVLALLFMHQISLDDERAAYKAERRQQPKWKRK